MQRTKCNECVCVFVRISKTIFLCMHIDCEQISVHFDQFFRPRAIFRLKVEFDFDFDETSFISIKKTTQDARAHFNPHAQMSDFLPSLRLFGFCWTQVQICLVCARLLFVHFINLLKFLSRNFCSLNFYLSCIPNWIFTRWQVTSTNQQTNKTDERENTYKNFMIIPSYKCQFDKIKTVSPQKRWLNVCTQTQTQAIK